MNSAEIEFDINFQRAMMIINTKLDTPEYLFKMWRFLPRAVVSTPPLEVCDPWYRGLEDLLVDE
jgi:hypothetical protein